jgi:hypothetical protein
MEITCDLCSKTGFKSTQALHGHKSLAHADTFDRSWKVAINTALFSAWEVIATLSLYEEELKRCKRKDTERQNFLKGMIDKLQGVTVGQKPVDFKMKF